MDHHPGSPPGGLPSDLAGRVNRRHAEQRVRKSCKKPEHLGIETLFNVHMYLKGWPAIALGGKSAVTLSSGSAKSTAGSGSRVSTISEGTPELTCAAPPGPVSAAAALAGKARDASTLLCVRSCAGLQESAHYLMTTVAE